MAYLNELTDIELEKWQKKQMDQCRVENARNKLVELFGVDEVSTDIRLYNERSQNLEESAILMAINEHGLHQNNTYGFWPPPGTPQPFFLPRSMPYLIWNPSRSNADPLPRSTNSGAPDSQEHSDDSSCSNHDTSQILEAAVSLAIENQGLGLGVSEPNR